MCRESQQGKCDKGRDPALKESLPLPRGRRFTVWSHDTDDTKGWSRSFEVTVSTEGFHPLVLKPGFSVSGATLIFRSVLKPEDYVFGCVGGAWR